MFKKFSLFVFVFLAMILMACNNQNAAQPANFLPWTWRDSVVGCWSTAYKMPDGKFEIFNTDSTSPDGRWICAEDSPTGPWKFQRAEADAANTSAGTIDTTSCGVGQCQTPPSAPQPVTSSTCTVRFWQDDVNGKGGGWMFEVADGDRQDGAATLDMKYWNGSGAGISFVDVPVGCQVEIFDQGGPSGHNKILGYGQWDLQTIQRLLLDNQPQGSPCMPGVEPGCWSDHVIAVQVSAIP